MTFATITERLHPAPRRVGVLAGTAMRQVEFEVGEFGIVAALAPSGS